MLAVVEKSLCPSQSGICFSGTSFASKSEAQLCPYGIIRTNRKTLALQWVSWFILILFPSICPAKIGMTRVAKK